MDELTHLTNYFKESSRVPRTHGTREKVDNKCVKFVKSVKCATDFSGTTHEGQAPLVRIVKYSLFFGGFGKSVYLCSDN